MPPPANLVEQRLAGHQLHHAVVTRQNFKIVLIEGSEQSATAKDTFLDWFKRHKEPPILFVFDLAQSQSPRRTSRSSVAGRH